MYLHRKVKLVLTYSRQTPRGDNWPSDARQSAFDINSFWQSIRLGEAAAGQSLGNVNRNIALPPLSVYLSPHAGTFPQSLS